MAKLPAKRVVLAASALFVFLSIDAAAEPAIKNSPPGDHGPSAGHPVDSDVASTQHKVKCDDSYEPGSFLRAEDFATLQRFLRASVLGENNPQLKAEKMKRWNKVEGAEVTAAALAVLRHPEKTIVKFGMFTDPGERDTDHIGDGDAGAGLRIVFQREIGGKLISIITFWRINPTTRKIEQMTGPDAMRVRVELAPYQSGKKAPTWVGLAYDLVADDKGAIRGAAPLDYFDPKTGEKTHQPQVKIGPAGCQSCHSHRDPARDQVDPDDNASEIPSGITAMVNDTRIQLTNDNRLTAGDEQKLQAIGKQLKALHQPDPKTVAQFISKSWLEALQADCERYREMADLADELERFRKDAGARSN